VRHHGDVTGRRRPGICATIALFAAPLLAAPLLAAGCLPAATGGSASPATTTGPTASVNAVPSFVRPTPNPSPAFVVHEVRGGETLTSIARLYGTTARSIAYWNRDRYPSLDPDSTTYDPNRIVVGWTLRLIPTEVVDEDELPEPTAAPSPASSPASSPSLGPVASPA